MATLTQHVEQIKSRSKERLTFVKSASQLSISAEVDLHSTEFHQLKVDVRKFPLVFAAGASEDGDLVIDFNFDRLGRVECGFVPKVVVLSGINAAHKAKSMARGEKKIMQATAWIGNRALKAMAVSAADVSVNDVQSLLYKELQRAYSGKGNRSSNTDSNCANLNYMECPYVIDVYLFDSYAIVGYQGGKARQRFIFDPVSRTMSLDGAMIPVVEEFVDKGPSIAASASDNIAVFPPQGGFPGRQTAFAQIRDFGASNSEANQPLLRQMLNVEEALRCYTLEILKGVHKVIYPSVAVSPTNMITASIEANIAAKEAGVKNFSTVDFLKWQDKKLKMRASEQVKLVKEETLSASEFAHVGDVRDISTWFYPLHTSAHINAASKAVDAGKLVGIPKRFKSSTVSRIMEAAGTHTSGRVTANQPHKFVMNADEPDSSMCKKCHRSGSHPLHKVN